MANSSIDLTVLDFDLYKQSLINYLRSQPIFQDYDFTGANINVFLDLLARNTYQNGFFLNFVGSEMWLDSCVLRDSAVSNAKDLNYLPSSFRSAKALINLTITSNNTNTTMLTVPIGTSFTAKVGSNNYTFVTEENIVLSSTNGTFQVSNLAIFEGNYTQDSFVMDVSNTNQRFILSNPTVDTTTLIVSVFENSSANALIYTQANSLFGVTGNTQIYFLQAAENNQYEIIWGDNVLGMTPKDQSLITVQYVICNGELPNGANNFSSDGPIDGQSNVQVVSALAASGGAVNEDIGSIKFNAPRRFTTAERAITESDYEILLQDNFPEIDAVAAYGGETLIPPQYGKVFISLAISGLNGIPNSKLTEYTNFITARNSTSITPVFVSPQFIYASVGTTVNYNLNQTDQSPQEIQASVISTIMNYNSNTLNNFKATLYDSQLGTAIDETDPSIVNNDRNIRIMSKINPLLGVPQNSIVNFATALMVTSPETRIVYPTSIQRVINSNQFVFNGQTCTLQDDGQGNINIIRTLPDGNHIIKNTGTVNYTTGIIQLFNFVVDSYFGDSIRIYGYPSIPDISANQNTILSIPNDEIFVTVNAIRV